MAAFHLPITNLNGGELSPFLSARVDIAKYPTGLQTLENFLILPYGGIIRRPGTEYLGTAKFQDRKCMLFGFNFSTTTNFIIEFGHEYLRFWSNGTQVLLSTSSENPNIFDWSVGAGQWEIGQYIREAGQLYYVTSNFNNSNSFAANLAAGNFVLQDIYEVPTTISDYELRSLQFCPINDTIYIASTFQYPLKLTRIEDDHWTIQTIVWDYPPTLDENVENITITPSGTTGTISLTASADIFRLGHVGSMWVIGHDRGTSRSIQVALDASSETSSEIYVLGSWEFTTYGNWQGTITIQRLLPKTLATWETVRTYTNSAVGQRNVSTTGTEEEGTQFRLVWSAVAVAGTVDPLGRLEVGEGIYRAGVVRILTVTSRTLVSATVVNTLWSTAPTHHWSEAANSSEQGFFRTVALHESRLMWGGTAKQPLRIYGSFVDDYENYRTGSNADDSIAFRITSMESNPIQWMVSQQGKLIIGTAAEEIDFGRSDDNDALGPTNVRALRQSSYGSAYIQAKLINEVIMFVQRQGKKLREYVFAFEKDSWVGPDLTVLANHISGTRSEIVELAFQQQPDAVLWAVVSSQEHIATMVYERDQNVVGWSRQTTRPNTDTFESVATIYGGGGPDEVWFSIKRTIGGVEHRYIERMHSEHRDDMEAEDKEAFWYLDSAKRGVFSDLTGSVTGLDHLEGRTVGVYADGGAQPDQVVSGGGVTLETPSRNILVGLKYTSLAKPSKFNIPTQDGTVIGRKGRVHIATLRLHKSQGLEYSADGENWTSVTFRQDGDAMDASPPMFSGDQRLVVDGGYDSSAQLSLRSSEPFPLVILAIIPEVEYHGG